VNILELNLNKLTERLEMVSGIDEEQHKHHQETCEVLHFILHNETITPEQLDQFTFEQLEWALDAAGEAPILEQDAYQYRGKSFYEMLRMLELQKGLLRLRPVKKKQNFI
jgi:hypothetical protein